MFRVSIRQKLSTFLNNLFWVFHLKTSIVVENGKTFISIEAFTPFDVGECTATQAPRLCNYSDETSDMTQGASSVTGSYSYDEMCSDDIQYDSDSDYEETA